MEIIQNLESEVRGYVRAFPTVFATAKGAKIVNEEGKEYLDFFAGAGTLNYGHNNPKAKKAIIEYLQNDGIMHALDMATSAKIAFLQTLEETILRPRNLDYKVQFTGPTGTNAVESALKLARKIKNRSNIVAFTNAFHGLSAGSLAVTANTFYRDESHINRNNVAFMPFCNYFGEADTIGYFKKYILDSSSGLDLPAAVIVETIQAEGGINVASVKWLQQLEKLCKQNDILLIIDDIQAGNGRSGDFFSFEAAGIKPDMVTLSKSIGGGLPLALLLIKPELDQWKAGEHTGTFRGNNLAFVAAKELLGYWKDDEFSKSIKEKEQVLKTELQEIAKEFDELKIKVRGRGLLYGLEISPAISKAVAKECFKNALIIELCGSDDQVVKFLPPLTITTDELKAGINIVKNAIRKVKDDH